MVGRTAMRVTVDLAASESPARWTVTFSWKDRDGAERGMGRQPARLDSAPWIAPPHAAVAPMGELAPICARVATCHGLEEDDERRLGRHLFDSLIGADV